MSSLKNFILVDLLSEGRDYNAEVEAGLCGAERDNVSAELFLYLLKFGKVKLLQNILTKENSESFHLILTEYCLFRALTYDTQRSIELLSVFSSYNEYLDLYDTSLAAIFWALGDNSHALRYSYLPSNFPKVGSTDVASLVFNRQEMSSGQGEVVVVPGDSVSIRLY